MILNALKYQRMPMMKHYTVFRPICMLYGEWAWNSNIISNNVLVKNHKTLGTFI